VAARFCFFFLGPIGGLGMLGVLRLSGAGIAPPLRSPTSAQRAQQQQVHGINQYRITSSIPVHMQMQHNQIVDLSALPCSPVLDRGQNDRVIKKSGRSACIRTTRAVIPKSEPDGYGNDPKCHQEACSTSGSTSSQAIVVRFGFCILRIGILRAVRK
jgi:hypothetical protein